LPFLALPFVAQPSSAIVAASEDATSADPAALVSAAPRVSQPAKPVTARWLDLDKLSVGQRYRNTDDAGGYHLFEAGQERSLIEGRIRIDDAARYSIGFRASSGRYFNWAYSDYAGRDLVASIKNPAVFGSFTPAQAETLFAAIAADPAGYNLFVKNSSRGWEFYMRELYLSATPIDPVTVEFGSFGIERGMATEITTFDYDGYLSGERLRIRDPRHLFFDQIGFTNAYFGSVETPNFFARGSDLARFDYRQIFASKQLTHRVGFSGDYTWQLGTDTLRQAAAVGTEETKVVDKVRFEAYERVNTVTQQGLAVGGGSGFAVSAEKKYRQVSGDLGFASVDARYGVYSGDRVLTVGGFALNGDTYQAGRRPFMHLSCKIAPSVTAFGFYTHAVGPKVLNDNQEGYNAGLEFNLKALVDPRQRVF